MRRAAPRTWIWAPFLAAGCNALAGINEPTSKLPPDDGAAGWPNEDAPGDVADSPVFVCSVDGQSQDGPAPPPGAKRVLYSGVSSSSSFSNSIEISESGGVLDDFEWLTVFAYFGETVIISPGDWKERALFVAVAQ